MTENKRFTTVELPRPVKWGIWYDGAYLSTYQICTLLNELTDEHESATKEIQHLRGSIIAAIHNERTDIGKNVLMQLADNIGVEY